MSPTRTADSPALLFPFPFVLASLPLAPAVAVVAAATIATAAAAAAAAGGIFGFPKGLAAFSSLASRPPPLGEGAVFVFVVFDPLFPLVRPPSPRTRNAFLSWLAAGTGLFSVSARPGAVVATAAAAGVSAPFATDPPGFLPAPAKPLHSSFPFPDSNTLLPVPQLEPLAPRGCLCCTSRSEVSVLMGIAFVGGPVAGAVTGRSPRDCIRLRKGVFLAAPGPRANS